MKPCEHEWRVVGMRCGCLPGNDRADMECIRCGARDGRRLTPELFQKTCVDTADEIELELALLEAPPEERPA